MAITRVIWFPWELLRIVARARQRLDGKNTVLSAPRNRTTPRNEETFTLSTLILHSDFSHYPHSRIHTGSRQESLSCSATD